MKETLQHLAEKYETIDFIQGDPSWFMHQVEGYENKETIAFVASCLSYGNRKQFMNKIQLLLDCSANRKQSFYNWITSGSFTNDIPADKEKCFYRLYTYNTMHNMLKALGELQNQYASIKNFLQERANGNTITCLQAISYIIEYFSDYGIEGIIPKNTQSSCKRLCMFMRWMVRDNSPVDLGLWKDIIDKRTLIIPMDTHVVQEANRLGLMKSKAASMSSAIKLTNVLKEIFPDDPLKGDFALFGIGVDSTAIKN